MIYPRKKYKIARFIFIPEQFCLSKNFLIAIYYSDLYHLPLYCAHSHYRNLMFEICPSDDLSERVPS